MKNKVQTTINILLIIFMPFMMYINIRGTKVNVAVSDVILIFAVVLFFINIKEFFLHMRWPYFFYFVGLVLSLLLSQYASEFNDDLIHVGTNVMIIEIVKTLVVAMYFFVAFTFIKDEKHYRQSLMAISISSIPVILVGVLSYTHFLVGKEFFVDIYKLEQLRFKGTFEDPNLCALFFIIIFFVSLLNFKTTKNKFIRYLMLGISILSFFIISLTMSRGGWLAFAVAVGLLIIKRIKSLKKECILLIIPVIIIALLFIDLDYNFKNGEITCQMVTRVQESLSKDADDIDRIQLMRAAFEMGNDNFITGVGKGSFQLNSYKYIPKDSSQYKKQLIPHNTILGFYAQQGIVGVIIFIILPGYIFYVTIKSRRRQNIFFISVFIGIIAHSMTINIENTRFIWYMMGLMAAGAKINIDIDFVNINKLNKRTFYKLLATLLILFALLYADVSRKLVTNIYVYNGNSYTRKLTQKMYGDCQLAFDIQTDDNLHSVEIYDGDLLLKKVDFKSAYGVVQVPIHIEEECKVVFRSNEKGWMKVNNSYLIHDNVKIPLYNYVLLPKFAEEILNQEGLLVYSQVPSFMKTFIVEENKFDSLEMVNGTVTRYSNFSHTFQFDIHARQKVGRNYQLELLLNYRSISDIIPGEMQRNIWTHRFTLSPYTSKWKTGNYYTVKTIKLFTSKEFALYGRYFDYKNNKYEQESYFPIHYNLVEEKQDIINLGESQWINICYGKDKNNNINMTYNGWVESGRMNLQPGDYTINFKAQGSFLEGYSKVRIRDSELNEVAEITLDGNMKEYAVQYHVDEYKSGMSFILELINYKSEDNVGNRQVLLKDWLKVDRKLG